MHYFRCFGSRRRIEQMTVSARRRSVTTIPLDPFDQVFKAPELARWVSKAIGRILDRTMTSVYSPCRNNKSNARCTLSRSNARKVTLIFGECILALIIARYCLRKNKPRNRIFHWREIRRTMTSQRRKSFSPLIPSILSICEIANGASYGEVMGFYGNFDDFFFQ